MVNRSQNNRQRKSALRFPGIVRAARLLRVSRGHLWLVLSGRRESKPLLARYRQLNLA